jgi:hypothetical protein
MSRHLRKELARHGIERKNDDDSEDDDGDEGAA